MGAGYVGVGSETKKMVQKEWKPSSAAGPAKPDTPLGENAGTLRRLNNIANNTKATADNTKAAKRIGPGDIIFKNLPRALALRGAYREAQVIPQSVPRVSAAAAGGVLSVPAATQAPGSAPVSAPAGSAPVFNLVFNEVGQHSPWELEKWCATPFAMQWPAPTEITVARSATENRWQL